MAEASKNLYDEMEEEGPTSIHELEPKMRLEGTVTRIELYGAFVDIGVERDGLVHISQLSQKRVNRVEEVVQEGDRVTVWVLNVKPRKKRVDLTMIEPPAVTWNEMRPNQVYTGTVTRLESFGAFVDIGATREGLVHVSEITTGYIEDPREYVKVGEEVEVKVLKVDRRRRRIELSMKALDDYTSDPVAEEELEELPTEMELAWRQATREQRKRRDARGRSKGGSKRERDEIYSRTLRLQEDRE